MQKPVTVSRYNVISQTQKFDFKRFTLPLSAIPTFVLKGKRNKRGRKEKKKLQSPFSSFPK